MALEGLINIRIYKADGNIDSTQSGTASLYDNTDNSLDGTGSLVYNTTTQNYQYDFTPVLDLAKTYTVNVDFGASALVRYVSFGLGPTASGGGGLTPEQDTKLMSLGSSGGGGFSINYDNINNNTKRAIDEARKKIEEKIEAIPQADFEPITSEIKLASEAIFDKIEGEVDRVNTHTTESKKELKVDGSRTREVVKAKAEKLDTKIVKLTDRQDLIDASIEREADEIEEKLDEIYLAEADRIEDDIYGAEADEIEAKMN